MKGTGGMRAGGRVGGRGEAGGCCLRARCKAIVSFNRWLKGYFQPTLNISCLLAAFPPSGCKDMDFAKRVHAQH